MKLSKKRFVNVSFTTVINLSYNECVLNMDILWYYRYYLYVKNEENKRMKLNDLKYFVTLIDTQSFSETAEIFFISQPSISQSLKRLEEYLGTTLVNRGKAHEKLMPTKAGEILYKNAKEIVQKINETDIEIRNFVANDITLGIPPIIGKIIRPYIIEQLTSYGNKLKIIEEAGSFYLLEKLTSHDIPIAILGMEHKFNHSEELEYILLAELDLHLMLSKENKLADEKIIHPNDLENETFISLSQGYVQQNILETWIKKNNISFNNIITTSEISTAESLIQSNAGIGLFIKPLLSHNNSIEVIPLMNPPKFYISVVINHSMNLSSHQKTFNNDLIKLLKEIYKEISPLIK